MEDLSNLEFTPEEMRQMAHATVDRIVAHLSTLEAQPVCGDLDVAEESGAAIREHQKIAR